MSGGGEFRTGRTPYDKLSVALKIAQGTVTVEDMKIVGPAVRLALAGSASVPARELDLKGTAALIETKKTSAAPFELPFIVQGTWDDPIMLPDAEALIRRSGAAAPLLDAVREHNARQFRALGYRASDGPRPRHPGGRADRRAGTGAKPEIDPRRAPCPGVPSSDPSTIIALKTNHPPARAPVR